MSNPKTIWLNKGSAFNNGNGGLWSMPDPVFSAQEMRDYGSVEYRLVEHIPDCDEACYTGELGRDEEFVRVSEQSKIDRIRADIESMRDLYRLNVKNHQDAGHNNWEMMAGGSASACTNALEIIDRISKE